MQLIFILALVSNYIPVLLDWFGSLLMLGTIWGWLYQKLSLPIKAKLLKSERRYYALKRLMNRKYGEDVKNNKTIKGFIERRKQLAGDQSSFSLKRVVSMAKYATRAEMLDERGELSESEKNTYLRYKSDRRELIKVGIMYYFYRNKYDLQFRMFDFMDTITHSIFSGKIATVLFIVGFLCWNLSKLLSLYV